MIKKCAVSTPTKQSAMLTVAILPVITSVICHNRDTCVFIINNRDTHVSTVLY